MSTDQLRAMTADPSSNAAARKLTLGLAGEAVAASNILAALYGAVRTADTNNGGTVDPRLLAAVLDSPLGYGLALQRLAECSTPEHERTVEALRAELGCAHAKAVQTDREMRTDLHDLDGGLQ